MEERNTKLNELLSRLKSNRDLMAILLENVRTEHLEEAFDTFVTNLNNKELFVTATSTLPPQTFFNITDKVNGKSPPDEYLKSVESTKRFAKTHQVSSKIFEVKLTEADIKETREIMTKIAAAVKIDGTIEDMFKKVDSFIDKLPPNEALDFLVDLQKRAISKQQELINILINKKPVLVK